MIGGGSPVRNKRSLVYGKTDHIRNGISKADSKCGKTCNDTGLVRYESHRGVTGRGRLRNTQRKTFGQRPRSYKNSDFSASRDGNPPAWTENVRRTRGQLGHPFRPAHRYPRQSGSAGILPASDSALPHLVCRPLIPGSEG